MKTASPEMLLRAPKEVPWKMGPFLMVKVARSLAGAAERNCLWRGRVCWRGVVSETVARDLARRLCTALEQLPHFEVLIDCWTSRENMFV